MLLLDDPVALEGLLSEFGFPATQDETVREYVVEILRQAPPIASTGGETNEEEMESLIESLVPFWNMPDDEEDDGDGGNNDAEAQIRQLIIRLQEGGGGGKGRGGPQKHHHHQQQHQQQQQPQQRQTRLGGDNNNNNNIISSDDDNENTNLNSTTTTNTTTNTKTTTTSQAGKKNKKKESRAAAARGKRQQQHSKKKNNKNKNNNNNEPEEDDDDDNDKEDEEKEQEDDDDDQVGPLNWGGRGRGGRGEYAAATNSIRGNIHLNNVCLTLDNGTDLLQGATMDIVKGHRYGLMGRNGVGKSTLLRHLARKKIPGLPQDMTVLLVEQHVHKLGSSGQDSALQVLMQADTQRSRLLKEQEKLEYALEHDNLDETQLAATAERLGDIASELDAMGADTAEQRALEILKGLQFTQTMIHGPACNLSGGWRMRLSLAQALLVHSDLLLFDECTNHLDLYGLNWLIQYLTTNKPANRTLMVVSHDRSFLDAICTDVMVMEHQKLKYHVGNYSEYLRQQAEKTARETQILDAAERQRAKAEAFIQKQQQQSANSADPNKQRQAKMIKEKKLDRIGNYREDGKKYKQFSLKTLSEDSIRLAQKVEIEVDEPVIKMNFPDPVWPPGIAPHDALVRFEDFSFGYAPASGSSTSSKPILQHITLTLDRGSKVALVGKNGSGKSTLVKLISGELQVGSAVTGAGGIRNGSLWIHPSITLGHVSQYSVEELEQYAHMTVLEYAETHLRTAKVAARVTAKAGGNIRQYLGAFGLGGAKHAHSRIGTLSGGERMRLCFARILAAEPHLLLLDESTNHVDIETLESMSQALNTYTGSVLMVSHNQAFLSGFCKELWILNERTGQITVTHSDTETFDELFSDYRNSVMKVQSGGNSLQSQRQDKAERAKRATKQKAGAKQNAALL